ncbi:MAG: tetratricopeptide repeat protein [Nitrospinota bacterium]|nr:tetratricopeptide repeat protein [Nitrospinota bacterium]
MKNLKLIIALLFLSSIAACASAPDPALKLPGGANAEANKHNEEGISHYNQGHYDVALKHFHMASEIDPRIGESHYNEAISLDALGRHGDATNHFFVARKYAKGNLKILESVILNAHAPMKREGS